MEHRGIEYQEVMSIEPGIWKWTVSLKPRHTNVATFGTEKSGHDAIAAAERAIDRWLAPRVAKAKLVPKGE